MKKLFPVIAVSFLLVFQADAQTRNRYVFDNFGTSTGVQVAQQPVNKTVPQKVSTNAKVQTPVKDKKLVTKTVQQTGTMSMQDAVSLKNSSNYVQSTGKTFMSSGSSLSGFTTGDDTYDSYIVKSSLKYNIDPLLIYAQMHQESSFKLKALSYKGASGLMQLMPATARRLGVTNIYDPKQNIEGGIKYMRMLLNMFNQDVNLALAGYNAGEGAVMKYGYQIPPYSETREYVRRISARYSSISNPSMARTAQRVNSVTANKLEQKVSRPLSIFEPNAVAIRLADGRMRLVNQ